MGTKKKEQKDYQYHIGLCKGDIAPIVLLPGDPGRVKVIAKHLSRARKVAQNREYTTYTGYYKKVPISVMSTGIGCPSAAIGLEELTRIGAHTFIRVGTSGSLQPDVHIGDIVVSTGAVRDEGTSQQYIPYNYPAVANIDVVNALAQAARKYAQGKTHVGIIHSKDAFYIEEPGQLPTENYWKDRWTMWKRGNTLCTEMESSALFVVGAIKRVRVGSINIVVTEYTDHEDDEIPIAPVDMDALIIPALEAAVLLHNNTQ